MLKRTGALLLLMVLIAISMAACAPARAEIPEGVKEFYEYNKNDDSIIIVKKRMQELGYFSKGAKFTGSVNVTMQNAVLLFQKQNGLEEDGVIDTVFLERLFSEEAVGKDGKPREQAAEPSAPERTQEQGAGQGTGQEAQSPGEAGAGKKAADTGREIAADIGKLRTQEDTHLFLYILIGAAAVAVIALLAARKQRNGRKKGAAAGRGRNRGPAPYAPMPGRRTEPAGGAEGEGKTGIRISHPHYISNTEYECSACGARFTLAYRSCPECKTLFTGTAVDNTEFEEEEEEEDFWDEEDERDAGK